MHISACEIVDQLIWVSAT